MRKRLCAAFIVFLLLSQFNVLAAPELSGKLIKAAESAVEYLASGEYERLVTLLPFSGVAPGAAEWERFTRNYDRKLQGHPAGALAYLKGGSWFIAVPVQDTSSDEAEALMLISDDGSTFTGYRYATWEQVERECARCDEVVRDGL